MAYFFVDESGHKDQWAFVIIKVEDPKSVQIVIKNWRTFMKRALKNFNANEYKDNDASIKERKRILSEIARKNIVFWAIIHTNYTSHKTNYTESCIALLRHCDISQDDVVIAVDRVEKNSKHMEKHLREIKKVMDMPALNIFWGVSEREKGIQVADALAGLIRRKYCMEMDEPLFEIVSHLLQKEVIKIGTV